MIGRSEQAPELANPLEEVARLQSEEGLNRMEAIKAVAKRMRLPKREVYRLAAEQDNNPARKHPG